MAISATSNSVMAWMMDLFKRKCDHRHSKWNHKTFCFIGYWLNRELGASLYADLPESRRAMVLMATLRMCMPLVDDDGSDGFVLSSAADCMRARRLTRLKFAFKPLPVSIVNSAGGKKQTKKQKK